MNSGREAAFPILEEWEAGSVLLRCELRYSCVTGVVRGALSKVSPEGVRLVSEDGQSDVTINLSKSSLVNFGWGWSEIPRHGRVVVISFGTLETGPVDSVALAEIKS